MKYRLYLIKLIAMLLIKVMLLVVIETKMLKNQMELNKNLIKNLEAVEEMIKKCNKFRNKKLYKILTLIN